MASLPTAKAAIPNSATFPKKSHFIVPKECFNNASFASDNLVNAQCGPDNLADLGMPKAKINGDAKSALLMGFMKRW